MSGSTGADRVKSRKDFDAFVKSYTKVISKFPGFVSLSPSGSYNSNKAKTEFGDIDLIVNIKSSKPKKEVKAELAAFLSKLPSTVTVPFTSPKYTGKRFLNSGELVTVRYHDSKLGYSVQVDNIVALSKEEADFKQKFLDFPAERQGLILGLIKVATLENNPQRLFTQLGIKADAKLPKNTEYEFNLSYKELQLRKIEYEPDSYKEKSREIVWRSSNFELVNKILKGYDLDSSFEDLLAQVKRKLKNPRSKRRIVGVFSSMITVKSGEIGTPKGKNKELALKAIRRALGESVMTFKEFL